MVVIMTVTLFAGCQKDTQPIEIGKSDTISKIQLNTIRMDTKEFLKELGEVTMTIEHNRKEHSILLKRVDDSKEL